MSEQPQITNFSYTRVTPVQVKPAQDILLIVPERSPKIQYILGKLVPGKPEVPAIPAVLGRGQILESGTVGQPGYQPYVPAIAGRPETPAIPAVPDAVIPVDQGTIEMTDDEWSAWTGKDDNDYRTAIVIKRLSLTALK